MEALKVKIKECGSEGHILHVTKLEPNTMYWVRYKKNGVSYSGQLMNSNKLEPTKN